MVYNITVITINLNNAKGLKSTINSVVGQSLPNVEYIVIDGGSADGSLGVIKKYNDKIHFWVSEKDNGIYEAMNKAIKIAKGYYLIFLNSGDHFSSTHSLEKLWNSSHHIDIVYGNICVVEKRKKWVKKYPAKLDFKYLMEDTLPHPASLISKKLFDKVGFYDSSLKIVADWKFFILAIIKYKASYKYLDEDIAHFYFDGISSNTNNQRLIKNERLDTLMKCFPSRMPWINFNSFKKNLSNMCIRFHSFIGKPL